MKSIISKLLLASGLFLLPSLSAQASVNSTLRLNILCYYQSSIYVAGVKTIGVAKVIRLDSKQLIVLLGKQAGITYPGGSQLEVTVNGQVFITNYDGDRLGNVSKYMQANLDTASRVYSGSYNSETQQESTRNYFPVSFTMDLPGVKGTIYGMANEVFEITPPNGDNIQIITGHTISDVNGSGSFGGTLAHYNGNLTLDGRKARISK